ncbi:MAG: DUF1501 domain-containing protein [Verrucomicrobiales bacterium]|nr:DUF1501 domain-containing protein [Verrucomicrobiales bacterium]
MQPELKTRRAFLRQAMVGGALSWTVPSFVAGTWEALAAASEAAERVPIRDRESRVLVVLQLAGGNDGLNTVVPRGNDHYRRARPRLGLTESDLVPLNAELGWHPSLRAWRGLVDDAHLAVIPGVGYPNPNRSHFRSMEIWQTASEANRFEREGWLGRYFDHACAGADPTVGVNVGRQMPQAFTAQTPTGVAIDGPRRGRGAAMTGMHGDDGVMSDHESTDAGSTVAELAGSSTVRGQVLDFLDRTELDARVSSDRIGAVLKRAASRAEYPATTLAQSLKSVAQLIAGGMPTRVYYLSQGGYDTHAGQAAQHARLLQELGDATAAFVRDLKAQGHLDRVLLMSFSEFGRRVAENGSGGTDHGAAGPMFLLGARLPRAVLGGYPSLAPGTLLNGDLKFGVDFRSVYAAVLEDWLGAPAEKVLGRRFEKVRWT